MLQGTQELVNSGDSFAFETILSWRGFARAIPGWQSWGYRIEQFLWVPITLDDAIRRVAGRVRQGGHYAPDGVVRLRFHGGLRNFYQIYGELVDHWSLIDNSEGAAVLLEEGERE